MYKLPNKLNKDVAVSDTLYTFFRPIFGSHRYNLLTNDFDAPTNTTTSVTAATTNLTLSDDNTYRKHASVTATLNQFNWWTRSRFARNFTTKMSNIFFKQTSKTINNI